MKDRLRHRLPWEELIVPGLIRLWWLPGVPRLVNWLIAWRRRWLAAWYNAYYTGR